MTASCSCGSIRLYGSSFMLDQYTGDSFLKKVAPFNNKIPVYKISPGSIVISREEDIAAIEHENHVHEIKCVNCHCSCYIVFSVLNIFGQMQPKEMVKKYRIRPFSSYNILKSPSTKPKQAIKQLLKIDVQRDWDSCFSTDSAQQTIQETDTPPVIPLDEIQFDNSNEIEFEMMFANTDSVVVGSYNPSFPITFNS